MSDVDREVMDEASGEANVTDGVTGLPNRRGFEAVIENEERRCRRYDGNPAVFVIELTDEDVAVADDVLRMAATTLATAIRDTDVLARAGGGLFAVLATNCDGGAIWVLAGRVKTWRGLAGIPGACRAVGAAPDLQR